MMSGLKWIVIAAASALLFVAGSGMAQTDARPIPVPNAGFEEGAPGEAPPQWRGTISPGLTDSGTPSDYQARLDTDTPREGRASVRLEHMASEVDPARFGVVSSSVDGQRYRGRRVRLTGAVRVDAGVQSLVGLWLRVDREQDRLGFFDNMADRPIRSSRWADYVVEGDVAPDATRLVFGLLLAGSGKAWLDNVRLEDVGPARTGGTAPQFGRPRSEPAPGDVAARPLDERGSANLRAFARLYGVVRYFHPSDEAAAADWDFLALAGVEQVEGARGPAELAAALNRLFQPVAPSVQIYVNDRGAARATAMARGLTAVRWEHVGMGSDPGGIYHSTRIGVASIGPQDIMTVPLSSEVTARVPLVVWRDASGATLPRASAALQRLDKPDGFVPSGFDRTTRLAAVVSAWNLLEHFYPYFDVVRVDWTAELEKALRAAATDADDLALHATLRRLVAALHDGHGSVIYEPPPTGVLPIAWDQVEGRLVVTQVGAGALGVSRGDIVTHIGGVPAAVALAARAELFSGSQQWVAFRARADLLTGSTGDTVELRVTGADGQPRAARLAYLQGSSSSLVREPRPEVISEIAPGIVYVDLDRVSEEQFRAHEPQVAAARGLIFDLRDYPRMPPDFLRHLTDRPLQSAHFDTPIYLRPHRAGVRYNEGGWNMPPVEPRFTSNTVFITNGSAISYAESILGVVRGNRLADIIGEPSAGANGNVSFVTIPGGYRISWTAMRVYNRDGSQHHLIGVRPTVPVRRTLAGIRAGRDELLERALEIVRGRLAGRSGTPLYSEEPTAWNSRRLSRRRKAADQVGGEATGPRRNHISDGTWPLAGDPSIFRSK
jgi:hypothetical protein